MAADSASCSRIVAVFLLKNSAIVGLRRNHPPTHPINRGPNNNGNKNMSLLLVVEFTPPKTYPPTSSAVLIRQNFDIVSIQFRQNFDRISIEFQQNFDRISIEFRQNFDRISIEFRSNFNRISLEFRQNFDRILIEFRCRGMKFLH